MVRKNDWSVVENYLQNNMIFSALHLFPELIKSDSSEYRKFQYADTLRLCGFFSKSKDCFLSIKLEGIPFNYRYFYYLYFGRLYLDMGELEKAETELMNCLQFERCDTVPYVFIASILKLKENQTKAIAYLEQALNKEGDLDEVYYNLATSYSIIGDFQHALNLINKCLELDPEYPNALEIKKDINERIELA